MGRPLLVLDLDETLWHGVKTPAGVSFQLRPYLSEFLSSVAEHYDLAIWTAATWDWMLAGLDVVQASTGFDLRSGVFFAWHRTRATLRRSEDGGYEWRKPARKFRAKWITRRYARERILALDDQPANYACGYGHLVRFSSWVGDKDDTELLELAAFLRSIAHEPDLMKLEKRGWRGRTITLEASSS